MLKTPLFVLFVALCTSAPLHAADLEPTLGKKGKLLYEQSFPDAESIKDFNVNTGKTEFVDGRLALSELKSDEHLAAMRHTVPVTDCAVQLDFRFDGAKSFNFGYDPAGGQLKKKGHLFSVVVTPQSWSILEHNDKADPESKPKVLARASTKFEAGQAYTMLVECRGPNVVATVADKEPLKASASDFGVKKPGLVFRVSGDDDQAVSFDDIKVWELE